ncbi:HAD family hydrolase [Inconstantimicrobium mannanitabidum]|uniref:Uncharacterized protein n=1 Tax=Inconstantimicrobium mannanitabidum TaxID=1604901 RepID=A0ACB5RCY9_9CLOT|nr:HAD-IA family hydrolase [Clostridium sp. TW13]GKX66662.1 hypothetical protein rsdtw13_19200 [Clostridium sp. TW13]
MKQKLLKHNISVVFFDLFFTLITPKYNCLRNENDVLGISIEEWESYAEDLELYNKRATNKSITPELIIQYIIEKMKLDIAENDKTEILNLRQQRLKNALLNIDCTILDVLSDLKKGGKRICLISNADMLDMMHWDNSPLCNIFDERIFSCEVGYLKPHPQIYQIALEKMNVIPESCVFIGDGGSDELKGAKTLGMSTIATGYLLKRNEEHQKSINQFADYYIEDFNELRSILL